MGPQNEAEPIVANMREAWSAAFAARDLNALADLYTEAALFFGSTAPLYRGRDGVRAYFATLREDVVLEEFEAQQISQAAPDLIIAAGYWRFRFGAEVRPYRLSWTIVREGGKWLIAAHHASPRQ